VEKKGEGEGVRLALPRGGREEGGGVPIDDHDPRATATGGMAMTRRRWVRQRVWEQENT
jgi:hypothetical protein